MKQRKPSLRPQFNCEPLERRLFLSHFRGGTMIPSVSATGLLTLTSTTYWRPSIFPSGTLAGAGIDEQINSQSLGNPRITGPGLSNVPTIDVGSDPNHPHLAFRVFDTSDSRFTKITQQHTLQLPAPGLYSTVGRSSARVGGTINTTEAEWEMNSSVYWDGANASTPISFNLSGIQIEVVRGNNYGDTVGAVGTSGHTLSYDQALNLNINSQPPGLVINPTTGVISIPAAQTATYQDNPLPQNVGADYAFSGNIFARDAAGNLRGQVEFDGMFDAVGQPGHAPVVIDGSTSGSVGQTINFRFTGSDPDADPLTWSLVGLTGPGGATPAINPQLVNSTPTGVDFVWNTAGSIDGTWLAQVQARDPGGMTDIGDLTINLAPAPQFTPGVTVITHGYQLFAQNAPGWTFTMARAIERRVEAPQIGGTAQVAYYDRAAGIYRPVSFSATANTWSINYNATASLDYFIENILIFNWASESDTPSPGWSEAAGDALFASLVGFGGSIQSLQVMRSHFIGHSRGAVVNSEAIERLGASQVFVNQVTNLDPHDFDEPPPIPFDEDFRDWEVGQPQGTMGWRDSWGFTTWDTVEYADTFYSEESRFPFPNGREPGSRNRPRNIGALLGDTIDHRDVHAWYHGTIDRTATSDGAGTDILRSEWYPNSWDTTDGWNYARNGGYPSRPDPNALGTPSPQWNRSADIVFNGGFEIFRRQQLQNTGQPIYRYDLPGWQIHGGTGPALSNSPASVGSESSNDYLVLRKNGRFSHNRFFAPPGAVLRFNYRVDKPKNNSFLRLSTENSDLATTIPANASSGWRLSPPIPWPTGVHSLSFNLITNGNGQISVDNVRVEVPGSLGSTSEVALVQGAPVPGGFRLFASTTLSQANITGSALPELADPAESDDPLTEFL